MIPLISSEDEDRLLRGPAGGVRPIDTSTLGPIRFNPQAEPGRVERAREIVREHFDPDEAGSLYAIVVDIALEFEQSERNRNGRS